MTTNDEGKFKFELEPYNRGISDEEILADIRHVAQSREPKDWVAYEEYDELGKVSCFTVCRRFGSWNNALAKAGLQVKRYVNIPKENLFEDIEHVWVKLGRQPRREEMKRPLSSYSKGTYERRFGTWHKALEEFVHFVNSETETVEELPSETGNTSPERRIVRQPNLRLRFLVMRRDNFKCRYCGKSPATHTNVELEVDHVIPWSNGGQTTFENLQTLCSECNSGKSNLSPRT